jgi:hypothetical protein
MFSRTQFISIFPLVYYYIGFGSITAARLIVIVVPEGEHIRVVRFSKSVVDGHGWSSGVGEVGETGY